MNATCHPDRPMMARGLCRNCYMRFWRKPTPELSAIVTQHHESKREAWQRSRINGARPGWTTTEIAKLKRLYPSEPKATIIQEMAPRTWVAVVEMACKLGIERLAAVGGRRRRWKRILRDHVPVFELPAIPVEENYERPWS